jgi:hypothetical protein
MELSQNLVWAPKNYNLKGKNNNLRSQSWDFWGPPNPTRVPNVVPSERSGRTAARPAATQRKSSRGSANAGPGTWATWWFIPPKSGETGDSFWLGLPHEWWYFGSHGLGSSKMLTIGWPFWGLVVPTAPREDLAQCNLCRSYQSPPAWSAHAHSQ